MGWWEEDFTVKVSTTVRIVIGIIQTEGEEK